MRASRSSLPAERASTDADWAALDVGCVGACQNARSLDGRIHVSRRRPTMVPVEMVTEGDRVSGLVSRISENWVESDWDQ